VENLFAVEEIRGKASGLIYGNVASVHRALYQGQG